ncbi:Pentatricopeptide repeat-containing protein At3g02490, mitochondrial [Linum perenne]
MRHYSWRRLLLLRSNTRSSLNVSSSISSHLHRRRQFFSWISDKDAQKLSYESYIMMLSVLASNRYREECSDLVDTMIEKGYLPSKVPREKERLIKSDDEKLGVRIGVIVRDNDVWSVDVEKQIRELINVSFSAELVMAAIDILSMDPMKALMFFRWVDESGLYNHCQRSYNAVALVLGTKDCNLDTFWKVADEMKSKGYEMEDKMLIKLLRRLMKRNMNKEAVDLYEFAMAGKDYPSFSCLVLLMNELESAKQLDTGLHSRIMNSFFGNANALPFSVVKILRKAASGKPRVGFPVKLKNANEFVDFVKARGMSLDTEPFMPLAYSIGRSRPGTDPLETASIFFKMLINNQGISGADYALEQLVEAYCGKCRVTKMFGDKNRAADACKLLHECINLYSLKPLDTTYKLLISNLLLAKDGFKDALSVLDLMTSHGYQPFLDPFISYLSEQGTWDDAVDFFKLTTCEKFPATSLVLQVFEACLHK